MDYLEIANSPILWFVCAIPIVIIAIQSVIFVTKSLATSKQIGITDTQIKKAVIGSSVASVGPAIVVAVGALSLVLAMGGPISWLRLSFIGAVQFEMMAANFAAEAAGVTLQTMTDVGFANAVWVMTISASGWLLMTLLFAKKFDKLTHIVAGKNAKVLPVLTLAAMLGCFANLNASRIIAMDINTVAVAGGGLTMGVLTFIANKYDKKWINSWSLSISMVAGMLATLLV